MCDELKHDTGQLPWHSIVWDYEGNESAIVGSGPSDGETVPIAVVHDDNPHKSLLLAAGELRALAERLHLHINGLNATLRATSRDYAASNLCAALNDLIRDNAAVLATIEK